MWTPQIASIQRIGLQLKVVVSFQNKDILTSEDYYFDTPDLENLKGRIKSRLDTLNAQDAFLLPIGPIDITPAPVSQAQTDQQNYFTLLNKFNKAQQDIKNGLLKDTDPEIIQLTTDLKAAYKPEYSGL